MTKIIHAAAIACVLVLSLMTSNGLSGANYIANAIPPHDEKPHVSPTDHSKKNSICPNQSFLVGPSVVGATKILDVTYTVQNDEDSGVGAYWALDHFNKEHVKVWKLPDGSFYALKTFDGIFVAPTGGTNPGDGTQTQTESAFGDIKGGYVATFTGIFAPGANPTSGNIGTFNYEGTMSDILLRTYGTQAGAPNPYDWLGAYFTSTNGFADFDETHWGWSYTLDHELQSSTSMNQWCNYNAADGGNSGDILT